MGQKNAKFSSFGHCLLATFLMLTSVAFAEEAKELSYNRLGLAQQSFLSSAFPLSDRNYPIVLGDFFKNGNEKNFNFDVQARLALTKSALTTVNVREVYFQMPLDSGRLQVGRALWNWNLLDEEFQLGIWQPLFKAETLRRVPQGQTGLFMHLGDDENHLLLFASPFFIPHQGPSYVINGQGKFEEVNPWFLPPPRKIKLFPTSSTISDIAYHVNRPSDSDVLYNASAGIWYKRELTKNLATTLAFMAKPDHQLLLAFSGGYSTASDRGEVQIYPKIQRQEIYSAEMNWQDENFGAQMTAAKIKYLNLFTDQNLTSTRFKPEVYLGAVRFQVPWNIFKFSAAYFTTDIHSLSDEGPLAFSRTATTPQLPLTEGLKLGSQFDLSKLISHDLQGGIFYLWSQRNQLEQISFDLSSKWQGGLSLFTKVELLEAAELTSENTNEISQSAINDFLEIGGLFEF